MCLISIADEGQDKYKDDFMEVVERGTKRNSDGAGYMIKRKDSNLIRFNKGFSTFDSLHRALVHEGVLDEDILVVHSRNAPIFTKTVMMTHPFIVSEDLKYRSQTIGEFELPMLMHNGTFSSFNATDGISDTAKFVKEFLACPVILKWFLENPTQCAKVLDHYFKSHNKLALLHPTEGLRTFGTFIPHKGYKHSNSQCFESQSIHRYPMHPHQEDMFEEAYGIGSCSMHRKQYVPLVDTTSKQIKKDLSILNSKKSFVFKPSKEDLVPLKSTLERYKATDGLKSLWVWSYIILYPEVVKDHITFESNSKMLNIAPHYVMSDVIYERGYPKYELELAEEDYNKAFELNGLKKNVSLAELRSDFKLLYESDLPNTLEIVDEFRIVKDHINAKERYEIEMEITEIKNKENKNNLSVWSAFESKSFEDIWLDYSTVELFEEVLDSYPSQEQRQAFAGFINYGVHQLGINRKDVLSFFKEGTENAGHGLKRVGTTFRLEESVGSYTD